jgi:F420-dependent oxidoreductase-like protein
MRFAFWPDQSSPWSDVLELSRHAEATGWDGLWYADHFMPNQADNSGPTNESWTTVAALAALVPRVRIGPLVSGNTYRHPALVAKMAATLDIISGGRLMLGMGAGWQENEHEAYGLQYGSIGERLRRLDEACEVITGMLSNDRTSFDGEFYHVTDAPLNPKPVQSTLPLLIGAMGEKVALRIVAKHATAWNTWADPEVFAHKSAVLDKHCADVGRDPGSIERTVVALVLLSDDSDAVEALRGGGRPAMAGSTDEVRRTMQAYVDAGVSEFIVPSFNVTGSVDDRKAMLDRFQNEVASEFH